MMSSARITLVIDNPEQLLHGCTPSRHFDAAGGTIGSAGGDWVLDDRSHHINPLHCELRLREGRFCVIDRCGQTRLNDHDLALRVDTPVRLNNADRLHIGAYTVIVHLHHADLASTTGQQTVSELLGRFESPLDTLLKGFTPVPDSSSAATGTPADLLLLIKSPDEICDPMRALELAQPAAPGTLTLDLFEQWSQGALHPGVSQQNSPMAIHPPGFRTRCDASNDAAHVQRHGTGSARMTIGVVMLLTACLLLNGCTLLSKLGQVVIDPSIPVGAPGNQPTQIALSLYATRAVNPNPLSVSLAPEPSIDASPSAYAVTVSASSQLELNDKLQAVLDQLQSSTLVPISDATAPLMKAWESPGLGSYNDPMMTLTEPVQPVSDGPTPEELATPIAFKVLQLKDDSLLRNASFTALEVDLKRALGSTYIKEDDYVLQPGEFRFITYQPLDEATRFVAVIAGYQDTTHETTRWKQALRLEPTGRTYALLVHLDEARVRLEVDPQ